MEKMLDAASLLVSTAMPFFISNGDISSAEIFDVLLPFVSLSDILGFYSESSNANLALVIFADELDAAAILNRLDEFTRLAEPLSEMGVRMNGQSMGAGNVHTLFVYFDERKYAENVPVILPQGARRSAWKRIYLNSGFINVPGRTVVWSEEAGMLGGWRRSMASLFGTEKALQIFDGNDLQSVLILANE